MNDTATFIQEKKKSKILSFSHKKKETIPKNVFTKKKKCVKGLDIGQKLNKVNP